MPNLLRLDLLNLSIVATLLGSACQHPLPNPGRVVLSCGMQIVQDPEVQHQILQAFIEPDWPTRIATLLADVPGLTSEAIACFLNAYLGKPAAGPGAETVRAHAHEFLRAHGYEGS